MGNIISRHSKPSNVTTIEYTPYGVYTNSIIGYDQQLNMDDYKHPYSFNEWHKRNSGLIYGEENAQYLSYLKDWYLRNSKTDINAKLHIRNDYKSLLQQLSVIYKNEIDKSLFSDIDWNDNNDLIDIIPFYVEKLKKIAIYLANKRDSIKHAKLKYGMSGSKSALEKIFYEYLLKTFTKTNITEHFEAINLVEWDFSNYQPPSGYLGYTHFYPPASGYLYLSATGLVPSTSSVDYPINFFLESTHSVSGDVIKQDGIIFVSGSSPYIHAEFDPISEAEITITVAVNDTSGYNSPVGFYIWDQIEGGYEVYNIDNGTGVYSFKYPGIAIGFDYIIAEYVNNFRISDIKITGKPLKWLTQIDNQNVDYTTYGTLSDLTDINKQFNIQIEELYDDTNYFDKDPSVNINNYYNLSTSDVINHLTANNIPVSAFEWLYQTGINSIKVDNPLLWTLAGLLSTNSVETIEQLPLSAFSDISKNVLNAYTQFSLTKKYLGEAQYIVSGGYFTPSVFNIVQPIVAGNNWFYYPSGEYFKEANLSDFPSIYLTATNLLSSGATPGLNYKEADKIFIETDNGIEGAWLRKVETNTNTQVMSSRFNDDSTTIFKFPFPGYGTSAEALDYTGKQLNNIDKSFSFLDTNIQDAIKDEYWSSVTSNSSINPIDINNTNLINNGAHASLFFDSADKIITRKIVSIDGVHDNSADTIFQENIDCAWLYKFKKTDLPIKTGQNYIYWPLQRYNNSNELKYTISSNICSSIALKDLDNTVLVGAKAGYTLSNSDIIFKVDGPQSSNAIECAWLSGRNLNTLASYNELLSGSIGTIQPHLTLKCKPNQPSFFIWYGDNKMISETNICHHNHQSDCDYLDIQRYNAYYSDTHTNLTSTDNIQWSKCSCKSIVYSPFGHPGVNFDEYGRQSDIIVMTNNINTSFVLKDWRDLQNRDYKNSPYFAWYQLTGNNIEPESGWGKGRWVTYNGTPIDEVSELSNRKFFQKGYQYAYIRSNIVYNNSELLTNEFAPYLIIKEQQNNNTVWAKAQLLSSGEWEAIEEVSDMIINPGDHIIYDHLDNNWWCLSSIGTEVSSYINTTSIVANNSAIYGTNSNILSPTANPWNNFTEVSTGQKIIIQWPVNAIVPYNTASPVISSTILSYLTGITYSVSTSSQPITTYTQTKLDTYATWGSPLIYTPTALGFYTVNVTGYWSNTYTNKVSDTSGVIVNNVGNFIVVPEIVTTTTLTTASSAGKITFSNNSINYACNIPLSGWSYNINDYGARPFWAKADDTDSTITKNKGILRWGGGLNVVDDYVIISQPSISDLKLELDHYTEYRRISGAGEFTWIEPIEFITQENIVQWSQLEINKHNKSPLSAYLYNIDEELVVQGLTSVSDILLQPTVSGSLQFINYWAQNPFTWTQSITDTSVGLPPTGGNWIPATTGILVTPDNPYTNLTNRNFPTIAVVPYIGNVYSESDSGGYLTPKNLGANIYYGRNYITHMVSGINSAIFKDPNKYASDIGLTLSKQNTAVNVESYNASWMKANVASSKKRGDIQNSVNKEFIPYQTQFETYQNNNIGLRHQKDSTDPWYKEFDNVWENNERYPVSFRNEQNITQWYSDFDILNDSKYVHIWKTDIYSNNYMLVKDSYNPSINVRKAATGNIYIRDQNGKVDLIENVISLNNLNSSVKNDIISGAQLLDIWDDIIFIKTPNYLVIEKINFDYEENSIEFEPNKSVSLTIPVSTKYVDTWNFDNKNILISLLNVNSATNIISGIFYNYDINNLILNRYVIEDTDSLIGQTSAYGFISIDSPVLTYNNDKRKFSVTFFANTTATVANRHFVQYDYIYTDKFIVDNIDIIIPVDYSS